MKILSGLSKLVTSFLLTVLVSAGVVYADATVKVSVNGMVCDFCAQGIKKKFSQENAVSATEVNLSDKLVTLKLKNGQVLDDIKITKLLEEAGYTVVAIKRD